MGIFLSEARPPQRDGRSWRQVTTSPVPVGIFHSEGHPPQRDGRSWRNAAAAPGGCERHAH